MGLASVNLTKLAPKDAVFCELTRNDGRGRSRLLKVIDFGTNRKHVYNFRLVNWY